MSQFKPTLSLWWLISLAGIGALLVFVPPIVISQYERAQALGEAAGTIYIVLMGSGLLLLHIVAIIVMWRLWKNTRDQRLDKARAVKNPSQMSAGDKRREVEDNLASVRDFQNDESLDDALREQLDPLVDRVAAKTENQSLEIVAFGTISSGKSSLLNALAGRDVFTSDPKGGTTTQRNEIDWEIPSPGDNKVRLVDTPGLGEVEGLQRHVTAAKAAQDADLVLLVVDGPLRQSEFGLLQQLGQMEKRVLICLNKEDWYGETEREKLRGQIIEQTRDIVAKENVLAIRSRPVSRTRMRVAAGGEEVEEQVEVPADIQPLADRMMTIVRKDGRDLLLGNLLLQSRGLVEQAKTQVEAALDRRAWQIVEKYTWSAGGAAALSPFPMVDLAAGCAISTKMVIDLAHVYRQKMTTESASQLLGQMGKQLVGVLGVSVATPAVTSAVASMLKTIPGIGTIAGGALQGLVVALITRWIGAVFIQYFKHEMKEPPGGLANVARREWQRLTKIDELRKFVQTAHRHWATRKDEKQ